MTHQLLDAVHTRTCTGIKNAHNSVTVQNRTHVCMNFFDHKNLGNHLLQLCPKVVKHPVCVSFNHELSCSGRLGTAVRVAYVRYTHVTTTPANFELNLTVRDLMCSAKNGTPKSS